MKKEPKKGRCEKCGDFFYIHEHHILPESKFGKGETIKLCVRCHAHVHAYLDMNVQNEKDKKEVLETWDYWLKYVAVVVTPVLVLVLLLGYFL